MAVEPVRGARQAPGGDLVADGAVARHRLRPLVAAAVVEVHDDQVLDLPGNPRIIAMPGHSPGSIAIHVPAVDALFVGDALTTRHVLTGRRGPQPAPFTDEPRQALDSLTRLDGIRASWVLPGHGTPWTAGVDELLGQLRAAASVQP